MRRLRSKSALNSPEFFTELNWRQPGVFIVFIDILAIELAITCWNSWDRHTQFMELQFVFSFLFSFLYWNNWGSHKIMKLWNYRSSRPEVFCKKGVPRNLAKFTVKHLCQSLFFNKKRLCHRCFPCVNFAKFPRALFLQSTSGSYFWNYIPYW